MAHPNEDLIRRGYEAFNKGDAATLRELFDPEIVWHFPGRSVLAGDHRGTDAVLGFFGRTQELTAAPSRELMRWCRRAHGRLNWHRERDGRTLGSRFVVSTSATTRCRGVCSTRDHTPMTSSFDVADENRRSTRPTQ